MPFNPGDLKTLQGCTFKIQDLHGISVNFTFPPLKSPHRDSYSATCFTDYFKINNAPDFRCHLAVDIAVSRTATNITVKAISPHLTIRKKSDAQFTIEYKASTKGIHRTCYLSDRVMENLKKRINTAAAEAAKVSASASVIPASASSSSTLTASASSSSASSASASSASSSSSSSSATIFGGPYVTQWEDWAGDSGVREAYKENTSSRGDLPWEGGRDMWNRCQHALKTFFAVEIHVQTEA